MSTQVLEKKFRVVSAEFSHETNTFCIIPTTLDNFKRQVFIDTEEEIRKQRHDTRDCFGATFEAGLKYGWDLGCAVCASANPTGKVQDAVFDLVYQLILDKIREQPSVDGLLLHLHGAMVTESFEDAEGELLRRLRIEVGPNVPIVVTLDLHGNITELMADSCSSLIAVRTYPHIDFYERAVQGAELLQRAMSKEIFPRTLIAKRPQLRGLDGGKTQAGSPMLELINQGEALEREGKALVVSICSGFSASDIRDIGPSVTVTYDDSSSNIINKDNQNGVSARKIAEDFMNYAWETRHYLSAKHLNVEAAVTKAAEHCKYFDSLPLNDRVDRALVMAEVTDNPGSGHYGDATDLLRGLVEAKEGISNAVFYAIYDANAVQQGIKIGVGNCGEIALGGNHDVNAGGPPLTVFGEVVTLTNGKFPAYGPMGNGVWQNYGPSMLFRVGGLDIAVISNNGQLLDLAQLQSLGCDPHYKSVIVVKSNHHFRASLTALSKEIVTVDGGGLGHMILIGGNYVNVRRPIWPLDNI
jgi:microcystin degradation protein MlrC